jgi:hypothetical protein
MQRERWCKLNPTITNYRIEGELEASTNNDSLPLVLYCITQALNLPIINIFFPNPEETVPTMSCLSGVQHDCTPKP